MIVLDEKDLKLLLEQKKDRIGHNRLDGIDTVISGVSFLASALTATYDMFGEIGSRGLKIFFIALSIFFVILGICFMIRSIKKKYGHEKLYEDIMKKNINPHTLVAIKDRFKQHPNRFLVYYDSKWNCWFFPNQKTSEDEAKNIERIRESLSGSLDIDPEQINVKYMSSEIHEKYAPADDKIKIYSHKLYEATIPFTEEVQQDDFEIGSVKFRWMSIADMKNDKLIQERNMEVVKFVENSI